MFPVFSLVLDKDVKSEVAMLYPELYKDLLKVFNEWMYTDCYNAARYDIQKHIWKIVNLMSCSTVFFQQGRPLSFKTFLIWVLISIYQGKE